MLFKFATNNAFSVYVFMVIFDFHGWKSLVQCVTAFQVSNCYQPKSQFHNAKK